MNIKSIVYVAALACASAASAATYYSTQSGTHGENFVPFKWCDDSELKVESNPQPTPTANDGNTYVLLDSSKPTGILTFPEGTKVQMGTPDGKAAYKPRKGAGVNSTKNVTIPDCEVYGLIWYADWESVGNLMGNYKLFKTAQEIRIGGSMTRDGKKYGVGLGGNFSGASDVVINLHVKGPGGTGPFDGIIPMRFFGDFSRFKGQLLADIVPRQYDLDESKGYLFVRFESATSMGDTSYERNDSIVLRHRSHLYIAPAVTQSAARGITFDLQPDDHAALRANAGEDWTLSAPTYGTDGTVRKVGPGMVTLAGSFSVTNIVVAEGSLSIAGGASFGEGTKLIVKSGTTLNVPNMQNIEGVAIEVEPGASVAYGDIAYDDATRTATPVELNAETALTLPETIGIKISQNISLPVNDTFTTCVYRVAADSTRVFAPENFTFMHDKTFGLPVTSFEVVRDNENRQCVNLIVKAARGQVGNRWGINGDNPLAWSDGTAKERSGADYYTIRALGGHTSPRTGSGVNQETYTFVGDSYTMAGNAANNGNVTLNAMAGEVTINDARMYQNTSISFARASYKDGDGIQRLSTSGPLERAILGNIYIDESANSTYPAQIISQHTTNRNDICSNISGPGTLRLYSGATSAADEFNSASAESPTLFTLRGDNSGFTGQLWFFVNNDTKFARYSVTNANAFGGALASFKKDAVYINSWLNTDDLIQIEAEADIDVCAENRGWSLTYATFMAPEDVTFKFRAPLQLNNKLIKGGAGTLAWDPSSITTTANSQLQLDEGYLQQLDETSLTNLPVTVKNGAGFKCDCASRYGVKAKSVTAEGEIKVCAVAPENEPSSFDVAICTVPAANTDLTDAFVPVKIGGYQARKVVKETLTGEDAGFVRYSLHFTHPGFTVIIR